MKLFSARSIVLGSLLILLLLVGGYWFYALQEVHFKSGGQHWKAAITYNKQTQITSLRLRYIGEEKTLNNIRYEFEASTFGGSREDNRRSIPPTYVIEATLHTGKLHYYDDIRLKIEWNGQEETMILKQA